MSDERTTIEDLLDSLDTAQLKSLRHECVRRLLVGTPFTSPAAVNATPTVSLAKLIARATGTTPLSVLREALAAVGGSR